MTAVTTGGLQALDEPTLRGLLGPVDRSRGSRLLLITAAPEWDGPEVLDTDDGPVRVVAGRSVLAVRAAMVAHPDEFLAVLTPLDIGELGQEVRARAWGRRIWRPSPWDAVRSLFKVGAVDPALREQQWMVDLLVRLAPARGYRQPRSHLLDRDTAWRTLYRYGLQLDADRPTVANLLDWTSSPAAVQALERIGEQDRERIAAHLAVVAGPAAPPLLRLVAAGQGTEAVPLGLVADALWPDSDPVARVLLAERHLGRRPLDDAAALDWGRAAVAWVRRPDADPDAVAEALARADGLLGEVDAAGTSDSAVLDRAFALRLGRLGSALATALEAAPDLAGTAVREAEEALAAVREHLRARREPGRVGTAEAALRLCRRAVLGGRDDAEPSAASGSTPAPAGSQGPVGSGLAALALRYVEDGAWVDAARHRLAEGETEPTLVAVYEHLGERLDTERAARDRAFAAALAAEGVDVAVTPPDLASARPLPIEAVLGAVVAPVARLAPVLLLVVDGLSHAAAIELLGDVRREGWRAHGPAGRALPPVIAALPTVTKVSRASLLSGRLVSGGQDVEREGFGANPSLLDASGGKAPVLFHKRDLGPVSGEVAPDVRAMIADPGQRVVGVVVNALDDHLAKGTQLRLADGLEGVPLLRPVLGAAAEAQRAVVLASDHGHILGARQRVVALRGGGERYRPTGEPPAGDEVEVSGVRVLEGEHQVVLAAKDGVRYIPEAKHGYHGGATPAEVLCPLAVLLHGAATLDGWEPLPVGAPAWWDPASAPVPVDIAAAVLDRPGAPAPARPRPAAAEERQLSLLDDHAAAPADAEASRTPEWLVALLGSPRLAEQRRLAGRAVLDDDDLGVLLQVLVASGGRASGAALQRTLGLGPTRVRGKLQAARTLLDVEGYAVLRVETDGTAILNVDHLATQFEIPRPGGSA